LLLGAAIPAWAAVDGNKQELLQLRARIEKLKQEIEQAKEDHSDASDGLRKSERHISDVNRSLRQLDQRERQLNQRLGLLGKETAGLRQELQDQEDQLVQLLRHRYYRGGGDAAQLLMSGKDPNQISRELDYLAYIGRARMELIQARRANLDRLAQVQSETRANKDHLSDIKHERLSQKKALVSEQAERKKTLQTLAERISKQRREVTVLTRNEQRLARLIERLARLPAKPKPAVKPAPAGEQVKAVADASVAGTIFAKLRGRLALPVAGEILARFGQRREGGGPAWKGLFIRSTAGREVRAVASGEVVFADWLRGFGNLLIIDHGGGYLSLYSNNESLYKQPGEPVRAGDAVASVGSTGGQEEPGLYFELRHQGKPFDPLSWVAR
jgi:septal ring factor EnvC (AmiA/AmiB activator)